MGLNIVVNVLILLYRLVAMKERLAEKKPIRPYVVVPRFPCPFISSYDMNGHLSCSEGGNNCARTGESSQCPLWVRGEMPELTACVKPKGAEFLLKEWKGALVCAKEFTKPGAKRFRNVRFPDWYEYVTNPFLPRPELPCKKGQCSK